MALGNYKDIGIRVKVDSKEVAELDQRAKAATKSVDRLKEAARKGTSGGSVDNLLPDEGRVSRYSQMLSGLTGNMGSAAAVAGVLGGAVAGVGLAFGAAFIAGYKFWNFAVDLTKQFTEHVLGFEKLRKELGLSVEMWSVLSAQAERTDTKFDSVKSGVEKLAETVRKANNHHKESEAILDRLGIKGPAVAGNMTGAFEQTLQKIMSLPPGVDRVNASIDAFGSGAGRDMLAFVESFKGNTSALTEELKKLGVVLSEDDVAAAKEAKKAMADFDLATKGLTMTLTRELMPTVTDVFKSISQWAQDNRAEIKEWAQDLGYAFKLTMQSAEVLVAYFKANPFTDPMGAAEASNRAYGAIVDRENRRNFDKAGYEFGKVPGTVLLDDNGNPVKTTPTGTGSYTIPGKSTKQSSPRNTVEQEMRRTFEDLGFHVNRTFGRAINAGSLHPVGKAIDLRIHGKSVEELFQAAAVGIQKGWQLVDERVPRKGKNGRIKQTGPHYHFEQDSGTDPSLFLPASFYGGEDRLAYLKALDSRRLKGEFGRSGSTIRSIESDLFEADNKAFLAQQMAGMKGFYDRFQGIAVPDEVVKRYTDYLNKDVKRDRDKLDTFDVRQKYFARNETPLTSDTALPNTPLALRAVASSDQIDNIVRNAPDFLKLIESRAMQEVLDKGFFGDAAQNEANARSFELIKAHAEDYLKAVEDSIDLGTRQGNLLAARSKHEEIVKLMVKDQNLALEEQLDSLGKQYEVFDQLYGDSAFQKRSREILILEEKLGLQRENFDLENRIATMGETTAERYRNAWLQAIYDVRDANIRAIEEQIEAQVRIENQSVLSTDQIRARVMGHLAQQKTINDAIADGIVKIYDTAIGKIEEMLDRVGIGKIPVIGDILKFQAQQSVSKLTMGLLDAVMPGMGTKFEKMQNPTLGELKEHTNYLKQIAQNTGGGMAGSGSIGGGIFAGMHTDLRGLFGKVFSGGQGGGTGSGSVPGGLRPEDKPMLGGSGGNLWDRLKSVFSTGEGGIFAPQKNILTGGTSATAGVMSGIGQLAQVAGGMIGGKWGGVLGMAGTGASIGAMFGPWGAAIGAGVGALIGLFGGDPKRKADKQQNLPALKAKFGDAITELNKILADLRQLNIEPDTAITQATDIRKQIASGFGIEFQSKKYRKVAAAEITRQLAQADPIIDEIKKVADIARASGDRSKRIIGEFAGGVFLGGFQRRNGMLPGTFAGIDTIPAMLAPGEMVLNPMQQARVRRAAGFDVFKPARIPGYAGGVAVQGASVEIAQLPPINIQPNIVIYVEGVAFDDRVDAYMESDRGERKQVQIVKRLRREKAI